MFTFLKQNVSTIQRLYNIKITCYEHFNILYIVINGVEQIPIWCSLHTVLEYLEAGKDSLKS